MMWKEFEEIAGYEVSYETYTDIIEPMYMAVDVDKRDFVKMLNKKAFALPTKKEMICEMRKLAMEIFEDCGHCFTYDIKAKLENKAKEYAKRFYDVEWYSDVKAYVYFEYGYEYPEIKRGCTYPKEIVIGRDCIDYERITLIK